MDITSCFYPEAPLLTTALHPNTRATVIIPARNEEQNLIACLESLRLQTRLAHSEHYEVILLLNNCTDSSAKIASDYQHRHPTFHLHIAERTLPPESAHVGTARRLLMDTAWHRLRHTPYSAILSTDADTTVSPDWIANNLQAIEDGAEVVGGVINLNPGDIDRLDPGTANAYRQDRLYQHYVAHLESVLDPDPADPWPRHLQHFGSSLACTPAVYVRAGGLPPIKPLEDVAFIDACRRVDARIRHATNVSIMTSGRFDGRAEVGLSGQLRHWREDAALNRPHLVQSADYLTHRFTRLALLRQIHALPSLPSATAYPRHWQETLSEHHSRHLSQASFLAAIDCNRLIDETFNGPRMETIQCVLDKLKQAVSLTKPFPEGRGETSPAEPTESFAIPVG